MIINVINLKHRDKRRTSLMTHLEEMGCLYRFWEGVYNPSEMGFKNVSDSHKKIVADAKKRNLSYVLIAEDDLRFSSPKSLDYFCSQIPDSFDIYFGMVYTGVIQDGRITHGFSGLQFYLIHQKFFDVFLSAPPNKHIDMFLSEMCYKYEFRCVDPFICYGESGYSDNFKKQWVFKEDRLPRKLLR